MIWLAIPLSLWATWVLYVAVMSLKRARDAGELTPTMKALGYPALAVGLVLDFAVNVTVCTVVFLELPKEILVTSRLIRHKKGQGWRSDLANWICTQLLDALDPAGCHCRTD